MGKMKAEFTQFDNSSNWVSGKVNDDFRFEAKLFDIGSEFGIDGGRVSKLCIRDERTKDYIINYDREWDIREVQPEYQECFEAVMDLLENSPKRFERLI